MSGPYQRSDRVSDTVRREVSSILAREVKDPRIRFVTVTHVRMSKDLKNARVFFTSMTPGPELDEVRAAVKRATGFVQRMLAGRLHLRYTPHLTFEYDRLPEEGSRMYKMLSDIEQDLDTKE